MSRKSSEASAGQIVTLYLRKCGLQNEKYIYLDFAWIPGAGGWIEIWIEVVVMAVVLGARPFFVSACLCGRVSWRVVVFLRSNDREGATRLNARK